VPHVLSITSFLEGRLTFRNLIYDESQVSTETSAAFEGSTLTHSREIESLPILSRPRMLSENVLVCKSNDVKCMVYNIVRSVLFVFLFLFCVCM